MNEADGENCSKVLFSRSVGVVAAKMGFCRLFDDESGEPEPVCVEYLVFRTVPGAPSDPAGADGGLTML